MEAIHAFDGNRRLDLNLKCSAELMNFRLPLSFGVVEFFEEFKRNAGADLTQVQLSEFTEYKLIGLLSIIIYSGHFAHCKRIGLKVSHTREQIEFDLCEMVDEDKAQFDRLFETVSKPFNRLMNSKLN